MQVVLVGNWARYSVEGSSASFQGSLRESPVLGLVPRWRIWCRSFVALLLSLSGAALQITKREGGLVSESVCCSLAWCGGFCVDRHLCPNSLSVTNSPINSVARVETVGLAPELGNLFTSASK